MSLLKDSVQKSVKEGRICQPAEVKFLVQLVVRLRLLLLGVARNMPPHTSDTHKCMATTQIYKDTQITAMIPKGINSCQGFVPPKVMLENARFLREQPAA